MQEVDDVRFVVVAFVAEVSKKSGGEGGSDTEQQWVHWSVCVCVMAVVVGRMRREDEADGSESEKQREGQRTMAHREGGEQPQHRKPREDRKGEKTPNSNAERQTPPSQSREIHPSFDLEERQAGGGGSRG